MLLCDFGQLDREVQAMEEAGVTGFHLDVMDGHFVPNFTYGMPIVAAVRQATQLPLDVHLMVSNPEDHLEAFMENGADGLTIHVEAAREPGPLLDKIRRLGGRAGLALNPSTSLERILDVLDFCDHVLVMSVNPGFGGQSFERVALEKLSTLRSLRPDLVLEVDGGVNEASIGECVQAGAQWLVVGSALFSHKDYRQQLAKLRSMAEVQVKRQEGPCYRSC
jgi:ribulose-phosphate 3-epimerase